MPKYIPCFVIALICGSVFSAVWAGDPLPGEEAATDQLAIQGQWIVTHNEIAMLVATEMHGSRFAFDGDRFLINGEPAGERFVLGSEKNRKTIDFTSGPSVIKGIYKLEGDRLTLCTAPPQTPRPSRFETSVNSRVILTVLKRDE